MKIKVMLDQIAMNKSRKFVYFQNDSKVMELTENLTVKQAETVINTFKQLNISIDNQTGLNF